MSIEARSPLRAVHQGGRSRRCARCSPEPPTIRNAKHTSCERPHGGSCEGWPTGDCPGWRRLSMNGGVSCVLSCVYRPGGRREHVRGALSCSLPRVAFGPSAGAVAARAHARAETGVHARVFCNPLCSLLTFWSLSVRVCRSCPRLRFWEPPRSCGACVVLRASSP
jgi:hypothetical protein